MLLDEQAQLYAAQSPKHRLEVELAERPLTVRGDPNRLAQVVGNLLSNAIKYSPDGGIVEPRRGPQRRRRANRRAGQRPRHSGRPAEPHLHEVLPRRRGCHRGSPAPASASRCHARSSRRTAAASASTATQRGGHYIFGSSYRGQNGEHTGYERYEGGGRMNRKLGWLLAGALVGVLVARPVAEPARRRAPARRRSRSTTARWP